MKNLSGSMFEEALASLALLLVFFAAAIDALAIPLFSLAMWIGSASARGLSAGDKFAIWAAILIGEPLIGCLAWLAFRFCNRGYSWAAALLAGLLWLPIVLFLRRQL